MFFSGAIRVSEMEKYSEDQMIDMQEIFSLFDSKGDGKISISLIGDVLRAMGQNPTESDIRKCCSTHDPESRITFQVLLPMLQSIAQRKPSSQYADFVEGFKVFDKDQNGMITCAEARHFLTSLGDKMSDEDVDQLLQGWGDKEGNINYEEFIRMVMNG